MHRHDHAGTDLTDDVHGFLVTEGHGSIDGDKQNIYSAHLSDLLLTQKMMEMAKVGKAVERTAGTEGTKSSSMAQPKPATKPRTVARIVARRSATPPRKSANQEAPPSESVPPEP